MDIDDITNTIAGELSLSEKNRAKLKEILDGKIPPFYSLIAKQRAEFMELGLTPENAADRPTSKLASSAHYCAIQAHSQILGKCVPSHWPFLNGRGYVAAGSQIDLARACAFLVAESEGFQVRAERRAQS